MKRPQHLDHLLSRWVFDPNTLNSRMVKGRDGRDVIQMRVDMGVLQLETTGRPDGAQPNGCETYLDYLQGVLLKDPDRKLSEGECGEVDREFIQYYHRRICWLSLREFRRAARDADHSLAFMDFLKTCSPNEEWTLSHEQYRPFVLFHRIQAEALIALDDGEGAEAAVEVISQGLDRLRVLFESYEGAERFEDDDIVKRLIEIREDIRKRYEIGLTLRERLDAAVAHEQYELAAKLRDELAKRDLGPL